MAPSWLAQLGTVSSVGGPHWREVLIMRGFFAWCVRWRVTILTTLGVLPAFAVAAVTGNASWGHIVHVGQTVGEPSAAWLPVAVDGMMLTGAIMAWVDTVRGYRPRGWSYVTLILGSGMTLTFNVVSAITRGPAAMVVAAIYAITFLATVETILHPSKRLRKAMDSERETVAPAVPTVAPVEAPVEPVTEPAPPVTETEQADASVEEVKPTNRRPRRTRMAGHPGTGATGAEVDAAIEVSSAMDAPMVSDDSVPVV